MSEIRAKGKNASNKYDVPDEHSFSEDVILEQLQIIDTLFPSTKVRTSVPDVAEKRISTDDENSCSSAKRKKVDGNSSKCVDSKESSSICSISTTDKVEIVDDSAMQPVSRLELKESIKRAFEASKTKNLEKQSNDVTTPVSPKPTLSSTTKITRDIHQFISVVNPKGQMQKKLDEAAPYNFFLTTITDSKQTHKEPLSITFQGILVDFIIRQGKNHEI